MRWIDGVELCPIKNMVRGSRHRPYTSENRFDLSVLPLCHAELTPIRLRSVIHPTLSLRTGSSRPVSLSANSFPTLCTTTSFTNPKRIDTCRMSLRKAACEPCRKSKLACDHGRPACSRCTCQGRAGSCTYRASPFKRKQPVDIESPERQRDPP